MCSAFEWVEAERLEVAGTPIHVHLTEIFRQIETQAGVQNRDVQ
jgi:hypothetical protein